MSNMNSKQWYVVYCKPQKEEFAQFHLQLKGIEVFLPMLLLPEALRRRKRILPLFPNYLFVRIRISEEYGYVLWSPGVKRFVSFDDVPLPLEDNIVDYLMEQANSEGIIPARSNLKVGQEVRITGGPFDGLVGIIQDPPDAKGRVRVLMKLLSRQVKIDVPVHFVASGQLGYEPQAGSLNTTR